MLSIIFSCISAESDLGFLENTFFENYVEGVQSESYS